MAKLVIIGTIHQSTKNYTAVDLYNALEQIQPEVIFEELPIELHTNPEKKVIPFGEELEGQEGSAIKWYFDKYKVPVIPVDLPRRNKIYAERVSAEGYKNAYIFLNNLLNSNKPTEKDVATLKLYFETVETQRELAETGSMKAINSDIMDELVIKKHKLASDICILLLEKYSTDKTLADSWRDYEKWFEEREKYMASQIIKNLKGFSRAVFPVGADHRAGLSQKLINYSRLY